MKKPNQRCALVLSLLLGLTLCLYVAGGTGADAGAGASAERWTRAHVLEVADEEARRLGYEPDAMSVSFDAYNSAWRSYLRRVVTRVNEMLKVEKQLKGHDYWAVYYGPMHRDVRGGDLWVFVDQDTAQIITTVQGQ